MLARGFQPGKMDILNKLFVVISLLIIRWDGLLLLGQIISMQFSTYFLLGTVMFVMTLFIGNSCSVAMLFQYNIIQVSASDGRLVVCVFIISSALSSILLWLIVKKAKQCLDFSCTFHGFHLLACWWYNSSFPSNLSWWFLNMITSAVMCIGGEFLCLKSELNKIPIGYSVSNEKSNV